MFKTCNTSNCSVTFIVAISAVKAEPILPVTITAVKTGHNSLRNVRVKMEPTKFVE